jgi:hypothetical protein
VCNSLELQVCPEKGVRTSTTRGEPACDTTHTHITLTLRRLCPLAGTNSASSATVPTPLALLLYNTYMYSRPQSALIKPIVVCPLLLACFHELPTEETFARTSGAHHTIRAHVRGFGLTPLTAGRYASAARLPSRLPNTPSRSHSHTLVYTRGFHPRLPNAPSCYLRTRI